MSNPTRPPGLVQRYREELQARHYARRTVATYEQWLRRYMRFHDLRHPRELGSAEVNAFLTHLAVKLRVSASTQNHRHCQHCCFSTESCWIAIWIWRD